MAALEVELADFATQVLAATSCSSEEKARIWALAGSLLDLADSSTVAEEGHRAHRRAQLHRPSLEAGMMEHESPALGSPKAALQIAAAADMDTAVVENTTSKKAG